MATLKVFDGTAWQVVAGQGSPGQGVPAGGAAGALLAKNTAANLDTTWTQNTLTAESVGSASRLRINSPGANTGAGLQVMPPAASAPSADVWAAYGYTQTQQILRVIDQTGQVQWFVDKTGRPKQFAQFGTNVATTDSFGSLNVTFPEPFLTQPIVVGIEASGANLQCSLVTWSTTGCTFNFKFPNGGTVNAGSVRIMWIAMETRT